MREIKFRSWHYDNGNPLYEGYMYNYSKLSSFFKSVEDEPYSVEVMQYTGLKDKNGVEIYEGDIVVNGGKIGYIEYANGFVRYIVRYKKHDDVFDIHSNIEVIGNIYENKDLLN